MPKTNGMWLSDDGRIFMTRCPKCKIENYALCVASGVCAWCGYDANKDKTLKLHQDERD